MAEISRERAGEIAAEVLMRCIRSDLRVLDFAETGWSRFNLYQTRPIDPRDCWIVFYPTEGPTLRSSHIAVISKSTGEVLYEGSAHDEG